MVTFVYDNCDHNVESLHGLTMHCTNGIVIQRSTPNVNALHIATATEVGSSGASMVRLPKRSSFKPAYHELLPYIKSKNKDIPSPILDVDENSNLLSELISNHHNKVWYLSRYMHVFKQSEREQKIPSWKGFFHQVTSQNQNTRFTIGYLPSINDSPTKYEVVQEILLQCKTKAEALDLDVADPVLDHAIYSKALEVLFKEGNEDLKAFIHLRMGGFHASCVFLAVIGKRFGDLNDLIIESRLLGQGTVEQVMKGKHYNNAMRVHYAVAEAITRKKIESFIEWLKKAKKIKHFDKFMSSQQIKMLLNNPNPESFESCVLAADKILKLLDEYEKILSDVEVSPMAAFWQSYLEMFELLQQFQKSIKSGNWELHLNSCEKLLPWFHAYDHHNYARHFSYYWATQQILAHKHPALHQEFVNGNFAINRTPGSFNRISPDQAIE